VIDAGEHVPVDETESSMFGWSRLRRICDWQGSDDGDQMLVMSREHVINMVGVKTPDIAAGAWQNTQI
jgi:hypothetical protein